MPQSMLISRRKPAPAAADQQQQPAELPSQVAQSVRNLIARDDDSSQSGDDFDELDQQVAQMTDERSRLQAQIELLQRQAAAQNQRPHQSAPEEQHVDSLNAILYYNLINLLSQQQQVLSPLDSPSAPRVGGQSQAALLAPGSSRGGAPAKLGLGRRNAASRQQQQQQQQQPQQQQQHSAGNTKQQSLISHRGRTKAGRLATSFSPAVLAAAAGATNDSDSLLQHDSQQQFYLTSEDLVEDSLLANAIECKRSSSGSGSGSGDNFVHYCQDCGKSYSTSSNLARHRQTHRDVTDKKAKKCPECDKIYVSMPAFSMHLRTHNQGCICPICAKSFSRPWLLQGHMRTHTGEKPFRCKICDKAFADKSNLRAHIQTHSTTKPYVCGRCNKAFALKSYLCKHVESTCMRANGSQKEPLNLKVLNTYARKTRSNQ